MIITTTPTVEGCQIRDYLGIAAGEVIVGGNIFKYLFVGIRDIVGGRVGAYKSTCAMPTRKRSTTWKKRSPKLRCGCCDGLGVGDAAKL